MLSENEIEMMVGIPKISEVVERLRQQFLPSSPVSQISQHDFLSSILMAPPIGMALANGTVGLLEELSLNKKARSLSKGGFFLKQDPVVMTVAYLTNQFEAWEQLLYDALNKILKVVLLPCKEHKNLEMDIFVTMLNTSYVFIKLLETFFLPEGEEIIGTQRSIAKSEYEKLIVIGKKLELQQVPLFDQFLGTFEVK